MSAGVIRAKNKNPAGHLEDMVRCYVYSTEGAGTIRLASHLMMPFGGPVSCQMDRLKTGRACMWPYAWRLAWTRVLRYFPSDIRH